MICPKCGFEQEDAVDCIQCGIVIEKYRGPVEPERRQAAGSQHRFRSSGPSLPWSLLLRLALVVSIGLLSISYLLKNNLPDAEDILDELLQNPTQTPVDMPPFQIEAGEMVYTIRPLYAYELYGLVVSHHNCGTWWDIYHHDQWKDFINVKDLCVLWGKNVETEVYKDMRFTSDSWTCTYYWPGKE